MWEHYSRKTLDPEQRLAVELMMAENERGTWAARTTGRSVPRQNGKGDEIEVVEAWDLLQRGAPIVHTAHEIPTAKSAHTRMVALLEGHKDLRRKIKRVGYGNGNQMLETTNGGIIVYRTRTAGGGRGLDDIARLVVDEAQHAQPEQLASSSPILAVNPNPQTNFIGSAGIDGRSEFWWTMRKRALAHNRDDEFSWYEHSAETVRIDEHGRIFSSSPDPADENAWKQSNPAYPDRITAQFLKEQLKTLGPELFSREHLAVWDPIDIAGSKVFGAGRWEQCSTSTFTNEPVAALAVAATYDLTHGSIGASVLDADGLLWLKPLQSSPGTAWMVQRAKELQDKHDVDVVIDERGPAAVLIPELEDAGVRLKQISTAEVCDATADLFSRVREGSARHGNFPDLNDAVEAAVPRTVGDRWAWGRKQSTDNISPLEAVTFASWWAVQMSRAIPAIF